MRMHRIIANLVLSILYSVSATLVAAGQSRFSTLQQGSAGPQQMRGPAPSIPGPPHDPHDLTGVWNARRGYGGNTFGRQGPDLTEWGQQQFRMAKASNGGEYTLQETNDPLLTKCLPPGTPRIYLQPVPMQVIQTPKAVLFLYEYDHIVRHVFIDGRKHPADITPTYMGHSVGRWDGNIFVVDTVGFNDKTWLDRIGHAHSDQLHVIERFHRLDQNNLDIDITMEDAKALAKPWDVHFGFSLHADWEIMELACTDNAAFVNFEK
jgi:hypothetical protein